MDESATVGTRFGFDLGDNRSLRCGILRNARRTCPRQTQDVEGFIIFFQKTGQVSCIRSVCSACNHLVRLHLAPCFSVAPGPLSVKNRLDEVKFRCFPVKRTLRRQECSPRRSGGERTVYLSCSTKRFPPSCCFASRRQRSNETDAGRPVQRKLLAAGPANHTGGSRNRHGGDWLPGRPQGEGFRNPESGFCDRCGDVLRV